MSFLIWNQAIGEYWFNSRNSGRSIVLTADQNSLKSVAAQSHILLEGKTAAEHFGESVRLLGTWRRQELPADELPATSAYLALAILAVSYMDNASQQGMTSYWTPFKELYGCDVRDNQIPRELKSIWLSLWRDIEEWANRKNGGKYGIVRFPLQSNYGVRDPHKNIRYPKSQALLKLEDLKRLTPWFDKRTEPRKPMTSSAAATSRCSHRCQTNKQRNSKNRWGRNLISISRRSPCPDDDPNLLRSKRYHQLANRISVIPFLRTNFRNEQFNE